MELQYLVLIGVCAVVRLPLELVLGARVWRRPRRLLYALLSPVIVFSCGTSLRSRAATGRSTRAT